MKKATHNGKRNNDMNKKITHLNGFKAIKTLNTAAADPRIDEIEGYGMEEGRVMLSLRAGWKFSGSGVDDYDATLSKGVGSAQDVRDAMKTIIKA